MKFHDYLFISVVLSLVGMGPGCAVDERTGKALADALAGGPVRDYASAQADVVAQTCLVLQQQSAPDNGSPPDLPGAKKSWLTARAAYDRGVAVFTVVAPELAFQLDGPLDDSLATTGLRQMERVLFGTPAAPTAEVARLAQALGGAAVSLHTAVPDSNRPVDAASCLGSMAATAAQLATKFDGSISPYADAALLSVENNLLGLQAMYAILAPLVHSGDAGLDESIGDLLQGLLAQVRSYASVDSVTDKRGFLRQCAELSLALRQVGKVLGLSVTTVNLS